MDREGGEGEKLSGSLSWWAGPVGEDVERAWSEPPVQIPERTVIQDLESALCPCHCKHLGLKAGGSQGHSGFLGGSCVAWPHSAQI